MNIQELEKEIEIQTRQKHTSFCETDKNGLTTYYMKFGSYRFFVGVTKDAVEWQLQKLIKASIAELYIED